MSGFGRLGLNYERNGSASDQQLDGWKLDRVGSEWIQRFNVSKSYLSRRISSRSSADPVLTCPAASGRQISNLVPAIFLEVVTLHAADGFRGLTPHHNHHLYRTTIQLCRTNVQKKEVDPCCPAVWSCTLGMLTGVRGRVRSVLMRWRWSAGSR